MFMLVGLVVHVALFAFAQSAPQLPLVVAGGFAPGAVLSSDGTTWAVAPGGAAIAGGPCCGVQGLSYSPTLGRFVAASESSSSALTYSDDGREWVNATSSLAQARAVVRIDALSLFLAAGNNVALVNFFVQSADGRVFSNMYVAPTSVAVIAYNAGRFFFTDDNSAIFHCDGFPSVVTQWILSTSPGGLRRFCFINSTHMFGSGSTGLSLASVDGGVRGV
jgi:hypothetical protein